MQVQVLDQIYGGDGNDQILGGDGDDTELHGGAGTDYLVLDRSLLGAAVNWDLSSAGVLTSGSQNISGFERYDLKFGTGDDIVTFAMTQSATDTFDMGAGNDSLSIDILRGLFSGLTLSGGAGDDTLALDFSTIPTFRYNNRSYDSVGVTTLLSNGVVTGYQATFRDTVTSTFRHSNVGISEFENLHITGNQQNDILTTGSGDDVLHGMAGNDTLNAGAGADQIYGGDGNDQILGGDGDDILDGGMGTDFALYEINTVEQLKIISFPDGTYFISLTLSHTSVDILTNIEFIRVGSTNYGIDAIALVAVELTDSIDNHHGTAGDDALYGLGGNDVISALGGNDIIYGGSGNDRLIGGKGDDDLYGETGSDVYVIMANAGNDRIFGFEAGVDLIEFGDGPYSFSDLSIIQIGNDVLIKSANGYTTLVNIDISTIDASDFVFRLYSNGEASTTPKPTSAIGALGSTKDYGASVMEIIDTPNFQQTLVSEEYGLAKFKAQPILEVFDFMGRTRNYGRTTLCVS